MTPINYYYAILSFKEFVIRSGEDKLRLRSGQIMAFLTDDCQERFTELKDWPKKPGYFEYVLYDVLS